MANWREFLTLLLSRTSASIILIDNDPQVEQLCFDPRIQSSRGMNISQSIALIKRVDLQISVDSWSKYVAASERIPQVVIVPSQVEFHPPEYLARNSFEGIFGQPDNLLVGLTGTVRQPRTTLAEISELSPERLADLTLAFASQKARDCAR